MIGTESVPGQSLSYDGGKPALLFGNGGEAMRRTAEMLDSAGYRLVGQEALADAPDRLDRQASVSLVWLECTDPSETLSDELLDRLARLAESGAASIVASAPATLIDPLFASLDHPAAQILIDAGDSDRASAVSLAMAGIGRSSRVSDVGRDNAVRLRQLSDEMGRIASTLARLSSTP